MIYRPIRLQLTDKHRRNISIGIPFNHSVPTEMGYIKPLVENENSSKMQTCVILTYVRSFSCIGLYDINYKYSSC